MKLLISSGRELTIRDVGDKVLMEFHAGRVPLMPHGWHLLEDDDARVLVRDILDSGLYERVR
jgi:hypothetical protein